jgi:molybdenum cofactor cytidylyltransferase
MGRPKPNLAAGPAGETLLGRLVRTLLEGGIDDVVIVVGHEHQAVRQSFALQSLPARFVHNVDYTTGQLSSILAGLRVVDRPGVTAVLVALADVPFVSAHTVRAVLERYHRTRAPIVRPARGGQHGHPMVIDRSLFDLLRHSDPHVGAKPVVRDHATERGHVELNDDGAFFDIDTPEDYERALEMFSKS